MGVQFSQTCLTQYLIYLCSVLYERKKAALDLYDVCQRITMSQETLWKQPTIMSQNIGQKYPELQIRGDDEDNSEIIIPPAFMPRGI